MWGLQLGILKNLGHKSLKLNLKGIKQSNLRPEIPKSVFNGKKAFATKVESSNMATLTESFLNGTSAEYVEQMYQAWLQNPASVHVSWQAYFNQVEKGKPPGSAHAVPIRKIHFF